MKKFILSSAIFIFYGLEVNYPYLQQGWKYIFSGGGVQHHPLLNTQNHCEKTKKIAFQIGHKEIGKVTKFGEFSCVETKVNHLIEIPALRTYTYTYLLMPTSPWKSLSNYRF